MIEVYLYEAIMLLVGCTLSSQLMKLQSQTSVYMQLMSEVINTRNNGNFTWQASRHTLNIRMKGDLLTGIAQGVSQHMLKGR